MFYSVYLIYIGIVCGTKLVWLLVLLAATAWLTANSYVRIQIFLSHPSTVIVKTDVTLDGSFPAVTVCDTNPFSLSASFGTTKGPGYPFLETGNYSVAEFVQEFSPLLFEHKAKQPGTNTTEELEKRFPKVFNTDLTLYAVLGTLIRNPRHMILECSFGTYKCNESAITERITDAGQCFIFNVGGTERTYGTGSKRGLRLKLRIDLYDTLPVSNIIGPLVMIGASRSPDVSNHTETVGGQGTPIPLGFSTSIAFEKTTLKSLGVPYGEECSVDVDFGMCMSSCVKKHVLKECGCALPWMADGHRPMTDGCSMKKQLSCTVPAYDQFWTTEAFQEACKCPQKCKQIRYVTDISHATVADWTLYKHAPPINEEDREKKSIQDLLFLKQMYPKFAGKILVMSTKMKQIIVFIYGDLHKLVNAFEERLDSMDPSNISSEIDSELAKDVNDLMSLFYGLHGNISSSFIFNGFHLLNRPTYTDARGARPFDDFDSRVAYMHLQNFASELDQLLLSMTTNFGMILEALVDAKAKENTTKYKDIALEGSISKIPTMIRSVAEIGKINTELTAQVKSNNSLQGVEKFYLDPGIKLRTEIGRRSYAELNIYMNDATTMKIEQLTSDSFNSLMCDLGGTLGLCLGGSILTLVEIVDVFFLQGIKPDVKKGEANTSEKAIVTPGNNIISVTSKGEPTN